jgi:uncharacterized protein (DUF488 family)
VPEILTVGHSTHEAAAFDGLLRRHDVTRLVDVRAYPVSRRVPHASREALDARLEALGIAYTHVPELGGRRRPRADSANTGWESAAFRAYADHMQTAEFERGLARLLQGADGKRTAVMCAEGLWWRCHRRLVADALMARDWHVLHILPDGRTAPHELPPFARVAGGRVTYPRAQRTLDV